jgi:multidrug efflux pump subunit AcrA (membrane-fusion protein)
MAHPAGADAYRRKQCLPCHAQEAGIVGCRFHLRRGQKARISFDSMRSEAFDGVVEAVYSNDNNFLVRIRTEELPAQILPGMTADIAISIREFKDVLLVPVAALHDGKVLVRNGPGHSREIEVKIGVVDAAMAEVVSGELREGDRLVIRKKVAP